MSIVDEVTAAIADAMRKQDPLRLSALRMLKAAFMNRSVEKKRDLDDSEARQVVSALVKQRKDSIEQFTKGGRQDLADKEAAEILVLEVYLPPAADPAAVDRAVAEAIALDGRDLAEGRGTRDESGHDETGRTECGWKDGERAGAQATRRRLTHHASLSIGLRVLLSFGPGPLSTALKALIGANVAVFLVTTFVPSLTLLFGLAPAAVVGQLRVWQLVTHMFLHGGLFHILFNMLALWMFGTELERVWGTRYFLKFYFVTGIGAAALTVLFSMLPFGFAQQVHYSVVIGASGAVYGLLLAYAIYFPDRPIYMYFVFPIPARIFVLILGAIELLSSVSAPGGVANATHLGGLLVGYVFLKNARVHPLAELKYRYLKWKNTRPVASSTCIPAGARTTGTGEFTDRNLKLRTENLK